MGDPGGRAQITFPSLHPFPIHSMKVIMMPHINFLGLHQVETRTTLPNLIQATPQMLIHATEMTAVSDVLRVMPVSESSDYIHGGELMKILD